MTEEWKDIPEYEGLYQASTLGRIKSLPKTIKYSDGRVQNRKEKILKSSFNKYRGYARVNLIRNGKPKTKEVHRIICDTFMTIQKGMFVDHINGDRLDNSIKNLRLATAQQNQANSIKRKTMTSKYKGVSYHKAAKKWHAQVMFNRKAIYLGLFLCEFEAAIAYNKKALELFGEYALLNPV